MPVFSLSLSLSLTIPQSRATEAEAEAEPEYPRPLALATLALGAQVAHSGGSAIIHFSDRASSVLPLRLSGSFVWFTRTLIECLKSANKCKSHQR